MFDYLGSYDVAFHVAGVPIIMAAVILFFIPWAQRTSTSTNIMVAARSYAMFSSNSSNDIMTTSIISSDGEEGGPCQSEEKPTLRNEFPMFSIGDVEKKTSEVALPTPCTDSNVIRIQIGQSYAVIDPDSNSFVTTSRHNKEYFATHLLAAMAILQVNSSNATLQEHTDEGGTASAGSSQLIDLATQGRTDSCQDMSRPKPGLQDQTPSRPATTCTSEVKVNHLTGIHSNEAVVSMSNGGHHPHMSMSPSYFRNIVSPPTSYHVQENMAPVQSMQNSVPSHPLSIPIPQNRSDICSSLSSGMSLPFTDNATQFMSMATSPPGAMVSSQYFGNTMSPPTSYHVRENARPAQSIQNSLPGQPLSIPIPQNKSTISTPFSGDMNLPFIDNTTQSTSRTTSLAEAMVSSPTMQNSLLFIPIPQNRSTASTPHSSGMSLLFADNATQSTSRTTSPGGAMLSSPEDNFEFLSSPITSSSHIMPPLIEEESCHHPTAQLTADTLQLPEPLTPRTLSPSTQSSNLDATGLFQMSDINLSIDGPPEPPPNMPFQD